MQDQKTNTETNNKKLLRRANLEFQNATLVFKDEFGGITVVFCKEIEIHKAPYAQYAEATHVRLKKPRQRIWRGTVLDYDQTLAVLPGKVEYNHYPIIIKSNDEVEVSRQKYNGCDPRWSDEIADLAAKHAALYCQDSNGNISK